MSTIADILPLSEQHSPADQAELAEVVRSAHESSTPIYPIGGGTSLEFGCAPKRPGWGLSLAALDRVIDYPARDMTITVEAGLTWAELSKRLASEHQWLPIDAAQAELATVGGVVATAYSGPRRYGSGTIRDYVIGISAVDGRGTPFKAGGRVVKNVAGYDFCKLLTGSLGTLAVITQVTFKVKPIPAATALVSCSPRSLDEAERLLAALVASATTPSAVELLCGPKWTGDSSLGPAAAGDALRLIVGLEGTHVEVEWMKVQLLRELSELGASDACVIQDAGHAWNRLTESAVDGNAALVVKASVRPSRVTQFMQLLRDCSPACSIQAHAGNGIVLASFPVFSQADVSRVLIGRLRPAAIAAGGGLVVWAASGLEMTRQAIWGPARLDTAVAHEVKKQLDPKGLFNPGRFVYDMV